ncbi:hypothetical protein BpHYR1_023963 [Brachionus plicatilis]|uniref:Uncharacterized protein n=1 Tax=Brachionus plicatilis TaxID=10195 RepID=A0A3M7SPW3_BRAPC|nr:hypothetical protein BpHYR1_023963 [Brachionus plicatilis]
MILGNRQVLRNPRDICQPHANDHVIDFYTKKKKQASQNTGEIYIQINKCDNIIMSRMNPQQKNDYLKFFINITKKIDFV